MFTGQQAPSEVGSLYAVDGDQTYIWITNALYTPTNGFISVQWYNEANGAPQTLAAPGYEHLYNYGYRFQQQNTQNMDSALIVPSGLESTSLTVFNPIMLSMQTYYQFNSVYDNNNATLQSSTYTDKYNPTSNLTSVNRDMATYNMPVMVGQNYSSMFANMDSYHEATYDVLSGYALSQTEYRTHYLNFNAYM